ncbi:primosomal protein N' [Pseudonocardia asaccharolytica]|uniref:Probable replication restart protein PriA n=1 Tax=Pseudonocardia asaccharolytica DSM 44247 = NBRC 16224 TaxID=1123024 RepID=A0A511CVL7_9PSEU|nr:primosomal protein N' [Pseudonocardia asaccharolytica]GEL16620.1 putative primosomal protein N' [Pseudonocardia asaccharolytica DSM 44247 = NBRC 16224]
MTRASRTRGEWRQATTLPVARVAVDVPLAHLDRPFDYRVPDHLDEDAVPGVRLRVRFAGRLVDGYLLERVGASGHGGRLTWIERVVSPEPVLTAEVAALCRAVADRTAGLLCDVLRLAVPPRHATAEAEPPAHREAPSLGPVDRSGWARYPRGPALLQALEAGRAAHAVWQALPGEAWAARLAEAAAAAAAGGRGALLVVPGQRDVDALQAACAARVGADGVVALTADLGPAERYRRWLAVRRGAVRVVVGTRAAAFAPLHGLGLLAIWDDGDDLHAEPRAPYPHVRDVLVLRAHAAGAALVVGGTARTAEAQLLVESGWAREVVADRATVRASMPRVTAIGETDGQLARDPHSRVARMPAVAFEAGRAALAAGRPVLIQVPHGGYLPWLACARCREPARCRHCAGPLAIPAGPERGDDAPGLPQCRWCGRAEPGFRCGACGSRRLRASVIGSRRTAEELGRAFPGTTVRSSGGGAAVLGRVRAQPELVVATPGAEPPADGGYGAALLVDGWAMLARPDLRVAEETLRRWLAAAALVVSHTEGGRVVVMADSALPTVQALVRWDPVGHAATELRSRAEVGFPPAVRMAAVEGSAGAVAEVLASGEIARLAGVEVLGPVEIGPGIGADPENEMRERALLRVARAEGRALAAALAAAQAARTARKASEPVRVRMDPHEIG